jgi:predicted nucleotidyltransferase
VTVALAATIFAVTPDEYVNKILVKYQVDTGPQSTAYIAAMAFKGVAEKWAGDCLRSVSVSGSYAKLTAVSSSLVGGSDIDLFISLGSNCNGTMKELYEKLYDYLRAKKWEVKRQNVSLGIKAGTTAIDFVPGKHQGGNAEDHTLYVRRGDTWKKTNVQMHIGYVLYSGYTAEIRALKIWKRLHGLDFLSFYLELFAIRALKENSTGSVAGNMRVVLQALVGNLEWWQILDPANTNNVISDQHTADEKSKIAAKAAKSLAVPNWGQVIW